ncbi:septum formation family protein [Glaciihabitans sp. UYNi722]|uniref:septum formation family protein n=1 Tax=Glaciihabitans sp. UYNi722 TaxID=3156344 RepID=UPI0033945D17
MPATSTKTWARALTVITVGAAAVLLSGCSLIGNLANVGSNSSSKPGSSSSSATGGPKSDVFSIKVGDCLNDESSVDDNGKVTEVPIVECAVSHDSEVIASKKIAEGDGDFPGDDKVKADADTQCNAPFEKFVGATLDTTGLDYTYYFPSQDSWSTGDREILCVVYNPDGGVEGTLKDLGPKYPKTTGPAGS